MGIKGMDVNNVLKKNSRKLTLKNTGWNILVPQNSQ